MEDSELRGSKLVGDFSPLTLPCQGTFSGVGHLGSSSSLYKDFLSTHPSPGMVSTRYSSAGSSAVCSYPWGQGAVMGGISSGPLPTPQLTPGHSAYLVIPGRDTVQAVVLLQQVDGLAQETERQGPGVQGGARTNPVTQ